MNLLIHNEIVYTFAYSWYLMFAIIFAIDHIVYDCCINTCIVHELTGVPVHPPMILHEWYHFARETLGNHISDVTRKKLGLTTHFGHFSKWPPRNQRIPISRVLLHIGSWFKSLNIYLLGQGIKQLYYWAWQTIIISVKWKTIVKKNQDGRQISTLFP